MTETATEKPAEAPEMSAEDKRKAFDALPDEFKTGITNLNAEIASHNANVKRVKAADSQDPNQLKSEIYEQNADNNPKLKRLRDEELALIEKMEKIRAQAYKLIESEGLMPKDLTEEELNKLKASTSESVKTLRMKTEAMAAFETMMPNLKLVMHIDPVETRRGTGKTGGGNTTGQKRLRFKRITVNGSTEDDKGNTVSQMVKNQTTGVEEEKFTLGFLAKFLNKQAKDIQLAQSDLQDAYLKGLDENNLPDEHEFVVPHTYKDSNGNEHTVNFTIKAYR